MKKFLINYFVFLIVPAIIFSQESDEDSNKLSKNITFLNAANFDFTGKLDVSYLGKLNIFAPSIKDSRWGFNTGIMRIKFSYNDTSNSRYYIEHRQISPLDSMKQGDKYLREYNKYTTSRTNTVWSFYIQPMYRLVEFENENAESSFTSGIYLHLHGELLVNKTNVTTNITNQLRDTLTVDTSARGISYFYLPTNTLIRDRTFLNGYFGIGLTFNLDPFGNGHSRFFFQPTIGWTTNYPNWTSQDITSTVVSVVPTRGSGVSLPESYEPLRSKGFYLIRAEFIQNLSKNSQVIVGADIRGLFPTFNPLYAAYIGLNVNVDALAKLVSDK